MTYLLYRQKFLREVLVLFIATMETYLIRLDLQIIDTTCLTKINSYKFGQCSLLIEYATQTDQWYGFRHLYLIVCL